MHIYHTICMLKKILIYWQDARHDCVYNSVNVHWFTLLVLTAGVTASLELRQSRTIWTSWWLAGRIIFFWRKEAPSCQWTELHITSQQCVWTPVGLQAASSMAGANPLIQVQNTLHSLVRPTTASATFKHFITISAVLSCKNECMPKKCLLFFFL